LRIPSKHFGAIQYWEKLAEYYPIKSNYYQTDKGNDTILHIYRDLNPDFKDQISADDLVYQDGEKKGQYNTKNKWNLHTNTGTIAHLIQRNNALSAEVDIGAQATILRKDLANGKPITNVIELCGKASSYGNAKRNSDPTVSMVGHSYSREADITASARLAARLTLLHD
jgi:hypothetical protein